MRISHLCLVYSGQVRTLDASERNIVRMRCGSIAADDCFLRVSTFLKHTYRKKKRHCSNINENSNSEALYDALCLEFFPLASRGRNRIIVKLDF